ncbi:MAG TPA: MBL fold metallo-hydrolase [Kofleriaceae bacterium]|nr:MBL fold metallo-hydrolase [Kofleriaceae bacterium]
MKIRFWGVRGSIPAPGPDTNRYGGNTSCVSLTTASGALFIIDMGTGAMLLGNALMASEFGKGQGRASVFLSHAHWDHIQGFPFFPPVFVPGNKLSIWGNARSSSMLEGILEGQMNPHFSPIYTLKNLGASIDCRAVTPGDSFEVEGVTVRARPNPHGSGTALAYRFEENGRAFVYASDAGYPEGGGPTPEVAELYRGAHVLLHDCTYGPEDQKTRRNRGFSSWAEAAAAAAAASAGTLVMFHYDQDYSDDTVDRNRDACRAELDRLGAQATALVAAAEGDELEI